MISRRKSTKMTNSEMESNTLNNECNSSRSGLILPSGGGPVSTGGLLVVSSPIQATAPVIFGSQLVDKNSSTPYSDATKVKKQTRCNHAKKNSAKNTCACQKQPGVCIFVVEPPKIRRSQCVLLCVFYYYTKIYKSVYCSRR